MRFHQMETGFHRLCFGTSESALVQDSLNPTWNASLEMSAALVALDP